MATPTISGLARLRRFQRSRRHRHRPPPRRCRRRRARPTPARRRSAGHGRDRDRDSQRCHPTAPAVGPRGDHRMVGATTDRVARRRQQFRYASAAQPGPARDPAKSRERGPSPPRAPRRRRGRACRQRGFSRLRGPATGPVCRSLGSRWRRRDGCPESSSPGASGPLVALSDARSGCSPHDAAATRTLPPLPRHGNTEIGDHGRSLAAALGPRSDLGGAPGFPLWCGDDPP